MEETRHGALLSFVSLQTRRNVPRPDRHPLPFKNAQISVSQVKVSPSRLVLTLFSPSHSLSPSLKRPTEEERRRRVRNVYFTLVDLVFHAVRPSGSLSTTFVTPRTESNLCELPMPPMIGSKAQGKSANEIQWPPLKRASSAHSLKQLAKVSFSRYLHSHGSIRMPVASKGREEGRLPPLPFFLPTSILEQRSPPSLPLLSGVICVAPRPPVVAVRVVRLGRSCVHPLAAGRRPKRCL